MNESLIPINLKNDLDNLRAPLKTPFNKKWDTEIVPHL